jgi:glutathione S-transferase
MFEVHHYCLCPFSRKLRIILKERGISFELFNEPYWQRRKEFLKLNPAGETPILITEDKKIFCGNSAIFGFLEEEFGDRKFLPQDIEGRSEVRRLTDWFDIKFFNEVTRYILNEKIIKTVAGVGAPNSQAIQAGKKNIYLHMDYIGFLVKENRYLYGDTPTIADFAASAQLSVLDFVGDVPWGYNDNAKEWYALMKSRPSFKPILFDKLPNFNPPSHYINPDF